MPGLVRKFLIFAAVDGLILQPAPPRNHPPSTLQAIKIDYKGAISALNKDRRAEDTKPTALEAHGLVGLLKIATASFLVSITGREQVALIRGKPVYTITDVALIPLSDQAAAEKAIVQAREQLKRHNKLEEVGDDTDTEASDYDDSRSVFSDTDIDTLPPPTPPNGNGDKLEVPGKTLHRKTSIAEDVIGKKGMYGRFAEKWFSRRGWNADGRRLQVMSSQENLSEAQRIAKEEAGDINKESEGESARKLDRGPKGESEDPISPSDIPRALEEPKDNATVALLPKILRTTKLYFGSRSFFYSYDYDLSHGVSQQAPSNSTVPLYRQFDPIYFWNKRIINPFIEANQHSYVLPLLQGFVGQRAFTVDGSGENSQVIDATSNTEDVIALQDLSPGGKTSSIPEKEDNSRHFLLTLISRRSIKRAGLRYLRRGVDEEGNVANNVETEQILSTTEWDAGEHKVYSFTQLRGSIPLFFSQSPYSLKPVVSFWGSEETNAAAFKLHFSSLAARYGNIMATCLVDKHGNEGAIGEAYENHAKRLNENGGIDGKGKPLGLEWFDFHNVCRGMRFENVSILMNTLSPSLKSHGWTILQNSAALETQSGILRTNCMDCLDRTNVVQSACARSALEQQLAKEDITIDLQTDPRTSWFNTLWADNGDAISKQYAGTAALKGDYTRTRQRHITGALTDFGLTLSRYYNNIVNDYFAQALIDYLLGRASDAIFAEFEADMKSQDHFVDLRKVRQDAIDRCIDRVIASPTEDVVGGWTLSCPAQPDSTRSLPFQECVILLTDKAFYFCRLDWTTEKVKEFERVDVKDIYEISRGVYITSALSKRDVDTDHNIGFLIRFTADEDNIEGARRVNTRTLGNEMRDVQEHSSPTTERRSSKPGEAEDEHDPAAPAAGGNEAPHLSSSPSANRFLAFKALPPNSTIQSQPTEGDVAAPLPPPTSEAEVIKTVCEEIARVVNKSKKTQTSSASTTAKVDTIKVQEKDIISLAEAKKSTGYLEQLGYSIKRFVWT